MRNKLIAGSVAVLATLATAGAATAGTLGTGSAQTGDAAASKRLAERSVASVRTLACDGGHQKRVYNRIVNTPTVFGEGAGIKIPGAELLFAGPHRGRDTISVTFSAESQLRGNAAKDEFDWAELEVRLDGVPLQPVGGPGDPMALTGSPYYAMTTAQFCGKVGPGRHRITAHSKIVDNGTDNALSVWLDDYVLRVEQSE